MNGFEPIVAGVGMLAILLEHWLFGLRLVKALSGAASSRPLLISHVVALIAAASCAGVLIGQGLGRL